MLQKLAGWFEKGLRYPLHFFPRSSYRFAEQVALNHFPLV
jgi:hypothetical protein